MSVKAVGPNAVDLWCKQPHDNRRKRTYYMQLTEGGISYREFMFRHCMETLGIYHSDNIFRP